MNNEILPASEAKWIGFNFIQSKYHRAKVTVDRAGLATEGPFPVYHLEGNIVIPSRGTLSKLFSPAAEYTFKMQVHAVEGSILNYELR